MPKAPELAREQQQRTAFGLWDIVGTIAASLDRASTAIRPVLMFEPSESSVAEAGRRAAVEFD